jgi:hypothetical protein
MSSNHARLRGGAEKYILSGILVSILSACVPEEIESTTEEHVVTVEVDKALLCTGSGSCGARMAVLDSVPACFNGADMGGPGNCNNEYYWGGRYQCVEYAKRYLCYRHRGPSFPEGCYMMPALGKDVGACNICNLIDPHLEIHRPYYDGYVPTHGDLYVEDCKASNNYMGHVAVIDYISGGYWNWTLATVEQNRSFTGRASCPWAGALCIVHYR